MMAAPAMQQKTFWMISLASARQGLSQPGAARSVFVNCSWVFFAINALLCTLYWRTNRTALHKTLKSVNKG